VWLWLLALEFQGFYAANLVLIVTFL
jgi:hypothetical protein